MASPNAQELKLLQQILTNQRTIMSNLADVKTAADTLAGAVKQLVTAFAAGQANSDPAALSAILTVLGDATASITAVLPPPAP